jgi:hypothetical protein
VVAAAGLQAVVKVRPIVAKGARFDGCARAALLCAAREELGAIKVLRQGSIKALLSL